MVFDLYLNFNLSKCCVLHFDRSNFKIEYNIGDCRVYYRSQKSLSSFFSQVKFWRHFEFNDESMKKCVVAHVFRNKNPKILIHLHKTFVWPSLQYNSVIWSSNFLKIQWKKLRKFKKFLAILSDSKDKLSRQANWDQIFPILSWISYNNNRLKLLKTFCSSI